MRYSLLNFVACPETGSELACIVTSEKTGSSTRARMSACHRINEPGAVVGPLPSAAAHTPITAVLQEQACKPADPARNADVRIERGLLVAPDTGRWYPIRDFIPELLPDHLRDLRRDHEFLDSLESRLPPRLYEILKQQTFSNAQDITTDSGIKYKKSEMNILEKVTDPDFLLPGTVAPFYPGPPQHTMYVIRLFSFCLPMFGEDGGRVILDAGCAYAWTTEWMWKCGHEPIGIDITRPYLDVARHRLGDQLPYVIIGDTENLPIRDEVLDGVLAFEAFHHIPNRNRAMHEFFRTMRSNGLIVLAEPPSEHETVEHVQEVMRKYGILEKGMDLADVRKYVENTGLADPVQHYVLKVEHNVTGTKVTGQFLRDHSYTPANLFTIRKQHACTGAGQDSVLARVRAAVSRALALLAVSAKAG